MKTYQIVCFLILIPLIAHTNDFKVVEVEIANLREKAFLELPGIAYQIVFKENGRYLIPVYMEDVNNIHCYSDRKSFITTFEKRSSLKIIFDFALSSNSPMDSSLTARSFYIPYDQIKGWFSGRIIESKTELLLHNSSIRLSVPQYYEKSIMGSDFVYLSQQENSGGFVLPIFRKSDLAFIVSSEGYTESIVTIPAEDIFYPKDKIGELPYIRKDVFLQKADGLKHLVIIPYRVLNKRLYFAEETEAFDQKLHNRYSCGTSGVLKINSVPDQPMDLNFFHPIYGRSHYDGPIPSASNPFIFQFLELKTNESIHNSRLSDIIEGEARIEGTVTNANTGDPINNALVSLNDGEIITYTDHSGYYCFHSLARKFYEIVVTKEMFRSSYYTLKLNNFHAEIDVDLMPFSNRKTAVLKGTIIPRGYGDGEHVENVILFIVETNDECGVDKYGNFEFDPMPQGKYHLAAEGQIGDVEVVLREDKTKVLELEHSFFLSLRILSQYFEDDPQKPQQPSPLKVKLPGGFFGDYVRIDYPQESNRHVKWFLEGTILVNLRSEDGNPLIPQSPTLDYFTLKPDSLRDFNFDGFGKVGVKNLDPDNYFLFLAPTKGDTVSIPFQALHQEEYPKPFLIFDVYFKIMKDGNLFKTSHESELIQYPPTEDQLKRYPWMGQQVLY